MDDRLRLYSQREVQELYKLGRKIYGNPVPMFHPRSRTIPPEDALRGLIAENAVASMINLLTLDRDNLYVFHSVGISDDTDGETDHILYLGNTLLIVETKNRSNLESVYIAKDANVYAKRKGQRIRLNSNGLVKKVAFYQEMFPELKVEGILVVHFDTQKTGSEYQGCSVISLSKFIGELSNKVANIEPIAEASPWPIIKNFAPLCIRNELIP